MMPLLGNVAEIQNFLRITKINLWSNLGTRGRGVRLHTIVDRDAEALQENGVDGVVLVVIQITDDPSAERTTPPRSTHVRSSDVSSFLIQQGGRRV